MAIDFNSITLEVVDINTNATPDIFINQTLVTFSKRVLEDLNYPQYVQYCTSPSNNIFAIRVCKGTDTKATPFSKPKSEQTSTLTCSSKNLRDIITPMVPNFNPKRRYKITGEYDHASKVMYFDMATAVVSNYHTNTDKEE